MLIMMQIYSKVSGMTNTLLLSKVAGHIALIYQQVNHYITFTALNTDKLTVISNR